MEPDWYGVLPRDRAEQRLRASLSPAQQRDLDQMGAFEVVSNKGHRFRLSVYGGNPRQLTGRRKGRSYCIHFGHYALPAADLALALALLIRTDEKRFRRIARMF